MTLNWNKSADGLIPAIIQDSKTQAVLMLGYMNEESFAQTRKSGKVTFYSRSRQSLWVKGEASGHHFSVVEIKPDCDSDALLISVVPNGPACHRETTTCFESDFEILSTLESTVAARFASAGDSSAGKKSYTQSLVAEGLDRVIQKVGEEGIETVIAAKNDALPELRGEVADLLFHLIVLLRFKKTSLSEVMGVLRDRNRK